MANYVIIDLLPPGVPEVAGAAAGSPATIVDGDPAITILGIQPGLRSSVNGRVYLKRIDALCSGSGMSGTYNLMLRDGSAGASLMFLPVQSAVPKDRIVWEFPVPLRAGNDFALQSATGAGTWTVIANGFCL